MKVSSKQETAIITRQDVEKHPADLAIEEITIGTGGKSTTVKMVIPITLAGCKLLLNEQQLVKDVVRSLRIRTADDTGAREVFAKAGTDVSKQQTDVQATVDAWDRHSRATRAKAVEITAADAKDPRALMAALAAKGINIKLS